MAAVGSFWHSSVFSLNVAATNAYAVARSQSMLLFANTGPDTGTTPVRAHLGSLYISVDTIAAGATQITMRLCRDSAGDIPVIGDSTATISAGVTTAAKGGVTFKLDIPYIHSNPTLFLFWKTDVGTCNVRTIDIDWKE